MYRQSRRADDNGENSSEWEKIQGGIPLDEMYIFNTQEKIDPRSTDRFLLSHGQELLSKLRVKTEAFAWTVFGTVCVDPLWDDSEDLVYIARGKVIKRKGPGNGPMQQNTCLSTTIYRRWSLVPLQRQERFLCADFSNGLQTVNTNWNSLWKRWLPDFSWRPVRGGLCGNEEFEKAQAKIHMAHIILEPVLHGLKCLSKARSCASTRVAAQPARLPRRPGPHGRGRVHPGLERWEIVLLRASKPGVCSRRAPDSAGGLRRQRAKIRQLEKRKWSQSNGP